MGHGRGYERIRAQSPCPSQALAEGLDPGALEGLERGVGVNDTERLDWLERTHHVICYDSGEWFCAHRGEDGKGWTDRPMADSPRAAIDAAIEEWQ